MQFALQASRFIPRARLRPTPRWAHLIGIAGAGMSALADFLVDDGWKVTGSDLHAGGAYIRENGVIYTGHRGEYVASDVGLVVHSDAIGPENEERLRASQLGVRQYSYPQMLGELMKGRLGLAVAGTHGKSTTTALATEILLRSGLDPSVIGGGTPLGRSSGGRYGNGRHLLVEACEYHRNFLNLCPRMAAITAIEHDHVDCFRSADDVEAAFAAFVARLPANGRLIVADDSLAARRVAQLARCGVETFGNSCSADWRAVNFVERSGCFRFDLLHPKGRIAGIQLRIPGRHNVLNALAAAALAGGAGADGEAIVSGLNGFAGLKRRMELVGDWNGAVWYDDYAHHPTEVRAVLATLRQMFPNRRIWCIFQPHQLSRTRVLLDEFADSLQNADRVAIADVFPAREAGGPECRDAAEALADRARQGGVQVERSHALAAIADELKQRICPGDVLLTLGAGDIRKVWHGTRRIRTYRAAG